MYDWLTYYVKWHFVTAVKPEDFFLNPRGCLYITENEFDGFETAYSSIYGSEKVEYFQNGKQK